jgi:hypothetical protein
MTGNMNMLASYSAPIPVVAQNFLANSSIPPWIDVSGIIGNRMMFDSSGLLTYAPNNLLVQSNVFNVSWGSSANVTFAQNLTDPNSISNNAWTITSIANGVGSVGQAITANGNNFIVSGYVYAGTSTYVYIQVNGANLGTEGAKITNFNIASPAVGTQNTVISAGTMVLSAGTISSVGGGWYRISVAVSGVAGISSVYFGASDADASRTTSNTKTFGLYGAQAEAVTYQTTPSVYKGTTSAAYFGPRFDYPNGVSAGILAEESRTNVLTYSNTFSNAIWTQSNASVAQNITGPDGVANSAWTLTSAAGTTEHRIYQNVGSAIYQNWSLFVKAGTASFISLSTGNASSPYAVFDLGAGTVAATLNTNGSIIPLGNGWYRILASSTITTTAFYVINIGTTAANVVPQQTWNAAGTETIYIYGAQNEQLSNISFCTSYIPSISASATRAADLPKLSGSASTVMQGAAGTVLLQVKPLGNNVANQYGIYGNSVSPIYLDSSFVIKATNGTTVLSSGASASVGASIRAGLAWDTGPFRAISVNSSVPVTDANSFGSIGATEYIGSNNGANFLNCHIEAISFYNSKLTGLPFMVKTATNGAL